MDEIKYEISRSLMIKISDLLCDIAKMKPEHEIYEKSNKITKELYKEILNNKI